jgi:hypothetical protein
MIDGIECVRCHKTLDMFGFHKEAEAFEVELWQDGISAEYGDFICDECANLLVEEVA